MANSVVIQTILDGARNTVIKVDGILDTSDLASTLLVDPALLESIDGIGGLASSLRIKRIDYNVENSLTVNLTWDASSQKRIVELSGRGVSDYRHFDGLINNASTGKTGKININTQGWASSAVLSFTLILELIKAQ